MFAETESDKYSSVVVVVKTSSSFERFENLKGSKACFAEFAGIGKMQLFVNDFFVIILFILQLL